MIDVILSHRTLGDNVRSLDFVVWGSLRSSLKQIMLESGAF